MRIINIIDSIAAINKGIWMAAVSTAPALKERGIQSEFWFPEESLSTAQIPMPIPLTDITHKGLDRLMTERQLDPAADIIVTHGCWRFATRWGHMLRKKKFRWVYVPQGMLEPWPLQHKKWKKKIYLAAIEKPAARQASAIRAVSTPEWRNLRAIFPSSEVVLIPNGVMAGALACGKPAGSTLVFSFMSRLHQKKGIVPLAKAWVASTLNNDPKLRLQIAGPDEGELSELLSILKNSDNATYVGTVEGEQKTTFLRNADFFLLPSYSEGFPTAVLEAMEQGAIPLISDGCNFEEAVENGIAIRLSPDLDEIRQVLEKAVLMSIEERKKRQQMSINFVRTYYSLESIADRQVHLYQSLLHEGKN